MKILLVDDNKDSIHVLEILLKTEGYDVESCYNGKEAIKKLKSEKINLIISDILMPVMDGFRLCQECKKDDKLKKIPFVFYSATYIDKKDEEFALSLGARMFIRKPEEPQELLKIIKSVIKDISVKKAKHRKAVIKDNKEVLKLYNERLIQKLEKKMLDLEKEITKRKKVEKELRQISETQAVLLKDVNHRVRNNLSAIISMLYTEESKAEESVKPEIHKLFRNLIVRIKGLSTVHTMLAESKWKSLKISQLCKEVIKAALKSMHATRQILLKISPSDVHIGSDRAQYIALITNEMATNFVKHALRDRDIAVINIDIEKSDTKVMLHFRDDGPGYPQNMIEGDFSKVSTGFDVIKGIVKHSLHGELKLSNDNGAVTTIIFKSKSD